MSLMKKHFMLLMTGTSFLLAGFLCILLITPVQAANGSDFRAGRIIDDAVFYNQSAMSAESIQSFLQDRVPACDTQGSQPAWDFGRGDITRAQYAASVGWQSPPYTCLRDYRQNTPQMEAASGLCEGIPAKAGRSGAEIIYDVAQACHINPQVLLVLLQKEQSLILDTWPLTRQYRNATGFACPDTAPCDPSYDGFFYQVYYAARQFQLYKIYPNSYNYVAGRTNNIYYNPDLSRCGSSQVYIENQATAALYIYTPYQPNAAALSNLYGTGDNCSAYGNRNFWRLFTDWFGSTLAPFTALDSNYGGPRWMVTTQDVRKVIPGTNTPTNDSGDTLIPSGTQLLFVDKIYVNNQWYLRTAYDQSVKSYKAIPQNMVTDIAAIPFEEPRYMRLKVDARKFNPRSYQATSSTAFDEGRLIKFVDKFFVDGKWFYRTEFDSQNQTTSAFFATSVHDIDEAYVTLATRQFMRVAQGAPTIQLGAGTAVSTHGSESDVIFIDKLYADGKWYYRTETQKDLNQLYGIPESHVRPIPIDLIHTPYTVSVTATTTKFSLLTEEPLGSDPLLDQQRFVVGATAEINGTQYYLSQGDVKTGTKKGVRVTDVVVHELSFIGLSNPRTIRLNQDVQKVNLLTGELTGGLLPEGTELRYTTKTYIDGTWYLRTEFDTNANNLYGIEIEALEI